MSVYFFLHIPKTAGITIAEHLEENSPPGSFWRPPPRRLFGSLNPLPEFERVRAVALGHYRGHSLEGYFAGREIRRIVLLRDPVGLQLSYYNWRMLRFLSRGRHTYSFQLHLRSLPRNFMTVFLLRNWLEFSWSRIALMSDQTKIQLLQNEFSKFWFVGAYSDCSRIIQLLAPELDVPPSSAIRNSSGGWRAIVDWKPLTTADLSPELRQTILAIHPLDQLLWETWHRAGFEPFRVRPAVFSRQNFWTGWRHTAATGAFELFRVYRRGPARWPDMPKVGLHPIAADESRRNGYYTMTALAAELTNAPYDVALWRTYLTKVRCQRPASKLPAQTIGTVEALYDPALCLLKGEALACGGQEGEARPFLRFAPALAPNRSLARDMTIRAASFDTECIGLLRQAHRERDRDNWPTAAKFYRDALTLYPGHCNIMLEYARCLRAQRDWINAELYYRSARALGAWLKDVQVELIEVAARIGWVEPVEGGWTKRPQPHSISVLDDPPTRADIDLAALAVSTTRVESEQRMLNLLRSAGSIRAVICDMTNDKLRPKDDARSTVPESNCGRFLEMRRLVALASLGFGVGLGSRVSLPPVSSRAFPLPDTI